MTNPEIDYDAVQKVVIGILRSPHRDLAERLMLLTEKGERAEREDWPSYLKALYLDAISDLFDEYFYRLLPDSVPEEWG